MTNVDLVVSQALSLTPAERSRVVRRLIESLEADEESDDAEDARAEVIAHRLAELEAGRGSVVEAKPAIAEARAELARRRRG